MAKRPTTNPLPYDKAGAQLVKDAQKVVEMRARHTYSQSLVYSVHNAVMQVNEPSQSCSSCLVTRALAVEKWLNGLDAWADEQRAQAEQQARLALQGQEAQTTAKSKKQKPVEPPAGEDDLSDF